MSTGWPHDQVAPPGPDDENSRPPAGPGAPRPEDRAAADELPNDQPPRGRSAGKPSRRERRGQADARARRTAGGGDDDDYEWIQSLTGGRSGAPDPGDRPRPGPAAAPPPTAPRGGAAVADGPRPAGAPPGESRAARPEHGLLGRRSPGTAADPGQSSRNVPGPRGAAPIARFTPDISGLDQRAPAGDQADDDPYRLIAPAAGRTPPADDPYRFVAPAAGRAQPADDPYRSIAVPAEAPVPYAPPPEAPSAEARPARPAHGLLGRRSHRADAEPDQPAARPAGPRDVPPSAAGFAAETPPPSRGHRRRPGTEEPEGDRQPAPRLPGAADPAYGSWPDQGAEPDPGSRASRRAARAAAPSSGRRGRGRRDKDPEPSVPQPRGSVPGSERSDAGLQADAWPPRGDDAISGQRGALPRRDEAGPDSGRRAAPRRQRSDASPQGGQRTDPRRGDASPEYGPLRDQRRDDTAPGYGPRAAPRRGDGRPGSGQPADPRRADPDAGREPDPWSSRADGRGLGRRAERPAADRADPESASWTSPGFPRVDRQGFPTPTGEIRPADAGTGFPSPAERGFPPAAPQDGRRRRSAVSRPVPDAVPDAGTRSRRRAAPDATPGAGAQSRPRPAADADRSIPVMGAAPGGWVARPGLGADDVRPSEQTSLDLPPFPDTSLPGLLAAATARVPQTTEAPAKRGRKDPKPARAEKPAKVTKPAKTKRTDPDRDPFGDDLDADDTAASRVETWPDDGTARTAEAGPGRSRPVRKAGRRRSRRVYAAVGGVLVIAGAAVAFETLHGGTPAGPVHQIVTPQRIGSYAQAPALAASMKAAQVRRTIVTQSNGEARNVVAAVYEGTASQPSASPSPGRPAASSTAPGDAATTQIVLLIGGNLSGTSATSFISSFIGKLSGAAPTSAGPLGGEAACVPSSGGNPAECAWADNDTFGLVASPTLGAQALASEMRQMRLQVELRARSQ
jgi:hypothetical protein